MANNKKFSDFTAEGDLSAYTGLVGYDATDNYFITPAQLNTSLEGTLSLSNITTGIVPIARGGTGTNTTQYANLSPTSGGIDQNVYGVLPVVNGGTGSATTWKAVQQFIWDGTNGQPIPFNNNGIPNAADIILPFWQTPTIDVTTNLEPNGNPVANTKWVISNSASSSQPQPNQQSEFTLGSAGGGVWRIDVMYASFHLINFVELRLSLIIDTTEIPLYGKNYPSSGNNSGAPAQSLSGSLTQEFSGGEKVKVQIRVDGSGQDVFPANTLSWINRPPEITFTRVI